MTSSWGGPGVLLAENMNPLQWAQLVALASAALFFVTKLWAGYFVVNMTLDASVSRHPGTDDRDILVVVVKLTKGRSRSVRLEKAAARCTQRGIPSVTSLIGIERLKPPPEGVSLSSNADAWQPDDVNIRLPTNESTVLSCFFEPSHGDLCVLEVVVVGSSLKPAWLHDRFPKWHPPQWRTSLVSPALPPRSDTDDDLRNSPGVARHMT